MRDRIIVGLATLLAIVVGVVPAADAGAQGALTIILVVLGVLFGALEVDASDSSTFLLFTVAVGAAAGADVLSNIPAVGGYLDAIVDAAAIPLYGAVASVLAITCINRIKG